MMNRNPQFLSVGFLGYDHALSLLRRAKVSIYRGPRDRCSLRITIRITPEGLG